MTSTTAEDDSKSPTLPSMWGRWLLPLAAGLLVMVLIGTAVTLRQTRLDVSHTRREIDERSSRSASDQAALDASRSELVRERAQLASLVEELAKNGQRLALETANRDEQAAKTEQTRIELYNLRASLNSQAARVYVQNRLLGDLQSCLRSADQALNALSRGDTELGGVILDGARQSCESVNKYLSEQGLTT